MSRLREFLIKVCMLIFSVCTAVAILTEFSGSNVSAENTEFKMYDGGSIRLDIDKHGYSGLRFRATIGAGWYESQGVDGAVFGTLIYPSKNGELDISKSSTENTKALDGANVILDYSTDREYVDATIVFDDLQIKRAIADKLNEELKTSYTYESPEVIEKLETVKMGLYAKDFTARSYAIVNGKTVWADGSYTTSMQKVAARTLVAIDEGKIEDDNGRIKEAALSCVGSWNGNYYDGYVSIKDKEVIVDGIDGYQVNDDAVVVLGNENATVSGGKITLSGEFSASITPQKLYIFEEGLLKVVNLIFADNVLSTCYDVENYFNPSTWLEGDNLFAEITVLAKDIDMAKIGKIYCGTEIKSFSGYFDGRGHTISNLVKVTSENSNAYAPLFGDLQSSAIIKDIAFSEVKSIGYNVNSGLLFYNLGGRVENIYLKYSKESEHQQILYEAVKGSLTNAIIEMPYDENLDVDAWIKTHAGDWGRSLLTRTITTSAYGNMTNVQVITQLPLILYGTSKMAEPVYVDGSVLNWKNWFAYGENETELWYDFEYFYNSIYDYESPGLGLERGTANVQNTQVVVNGQSKKQGKTRVWEGVFRYDNIEKMLEDENNAENVKEFKKSKVWKALWDTALN